jgi:cytochrome c-type biogenesis protein CcmH
MTEAEPAESGAGIGAGISWRTALLRVIIAVALVAAIAVSGVAIYRNQRDRAGMPLVMAPAPRASPAPTVEDGITLLQTQVADDPENAGAWRNLGWSYFQRGEFGKSADALRHATRLDPTSARTLSFLGEALLQARRPEGHMPREARLAFDEAIKLDPKDARARYYRAVGWDLNGQHRRAINAWFALLKDTPADAPYASDIRAVIRTVGARHHIKVEKRLAEAQFAPPNGSAGVPTTATAPATTPHGGKTTVPEPAGERMRAVEDVPRPVHSAAAPGR